LAYLIAESFGLSGILAIVVCGMGMKQYIVGNISEQSLVTVNYFMKTLSSRFFLNFFQGFLVILQPLFESDFLFLILKKLFKKNRLSFSLLGEAKGNLFISV
jgi:NhaP-type Na+/H+ or K+/H+ antiporter